MIVRNSVNEILQSLKSLRSLMRFGKFEIKTETEIQLMERKYIFEVAKIINKKRNLFKSKYEANLDVFNATCRNPINESKKRSISTAQYRSLWYEAGFKQEIIVIEINKKDIKKIIFNVYNFCTRDRSLSAIALIMQTIKPRSANQTITPAIPIQNTYCAKSLSVNFWVI